MTAYDLFKRVAFCFDPELAHQLSLTMFSMFPVMARMWQKPLETDQYTLVINGNEWRFPVGLAAGVDENGVAVDFFSRLLFGALEVGTVTPKFQVGNDKPRLWRYVNEESLRNAMGFNNYGADLVFEKLVIANKNGKILGVNMGKNKLTSQQEAPESYAFLYSKFAPLADYLVINVSSPNTPGLRDLQQSTEIKRILEAVDEKRKELSRPLYLKISPDADFDDLRQTIEMAKEFGLSGIIATNTTIMPDRGVGGVSGRLLADKAKKVRQFVLDCTREVSHMEVIGVGGIFSFDDLWDFWLSGGKVVQIYSSFIYRGPSVLMHIKSEIDRLLVLNELPNLSELIKNIKSVRR